MGPARYRYTDSDRPGGMSARGLSVGQRVNGWAPAIATTVAAATAAAGVVAYSHLIEPFWVDVTRPSIALPGLPSGLDGMIVAQLSDFHLHRDAGPDGPVARGIARCNQARPDVVVFTGDYLAERAAVPALARSLDLLEVRPAYAVLGNHDYRFGPKYRRTIENCFTERGIELLDNRAVAFERAGTRLWFVGVSDGFTSHDRLDDAVRHLCADDAPRILLTHYPDLVVDLSTERFELALAGHTHGAQIHVPFLTRVALARSETAFDRGFHHVRGLPVYVNRGLGTSGRQLRLFSRPEVTLLTLRARTD